MDVAVPGTIRIVLVEEVVTPFPIDGAVGVVHPFGRRLVVVGRAPRVGGEGDAIRVVLDCRRPSRTVQARFLIAEMAACYVSGR